MYAEHVSNRRAARNRSGSIIPLISLSILAMAVLGGGVYWFFAAGTGEETIQPILSKVTRGEFVAKVLDQGEIQSAENFEIKCMVGSRNGSVTVIDVVKEGAIVKEGDWLVTLDGKAFEKEIETQRIAVSNAETAVIQADAAFKVAVAAKNEYLQGAYEEAKKEIENAIYDAQQEHVQASAYFEHQQRLQKKGFITKLQLRDSEIDVQRAQNKLDLANQRLHVLENITKAKELIQLDSDIAAAEVRLRNEMEARDIEKAQLEEVQQQLDFCTITVPPGRQGEVVFHKEFDRRGGSEWVLEPGAEVRERQTLIRLPNRDMMEVKVLVNEQSITSVAAGMPATIAVDALSNLNLKGYVTRVNQYAEQGGGWGRSTTIREYAVYVRILDPPPALIPGMNAAVTIQTQFEQSALQVPLQCIYAASDQHFALKKTGPNAYETIEVKIGGDNSQSVWLVEGASEGDELVMNPGAYKNIMDLPEIAAESRIELPEGTGVTSDEQPSAGAGGADSSEEGDRGDGEGRRGQGRSGRGEGRGGRGEGRGRGGDTQEMLNGMIQQLDTDGNGELSLLEWESVDNRAAAMIENPDADGDGIVSRREITKAFEALRARFERAGGGGD